ncbi:MAG: HutD family protein [Oscillospiraceae bacterium]|nr:HutD family protein [Oscillospiraceae bacterium]
MQPILTKLEPADYLTTQWSGGSTTQLIIAPEGAAYADRDFLWRVSSATVELDESDFTPLPDYRRYISTVRGDMTLSHNGGDALTLRPGDVHKFDGGDDTHSFGRCTDFNLMLRKGKADGTMRSLRISGGAADFQAEQRAETILLYCAEGAADVSCGSLRRRLAAGESLLAKNAAGAVFRIDHAEHALLMIAQAWRAEQPV